MERKREAPAVVAPIAVVVQRLCRSARPLCIGAMPLCLVHLAAPPVQPPHPVHPPLLSVAAGAPAPAPFFAQAALEVLSSPDLALETVEFRSPSPAPLENRPGGEVPPATAAPVDTLDTIRHAAELLAEVDTAFGVPSSPYGQLIYDVAVRHSINPHLVAAMIHVESAFNPRAVSRKGACGLMQLLPATARRFGLRKKKDLFDPQKNLQAGVRYLKWLTLRFGGDVEKILAAYNAGEGAVERFGGIPPYRETRQYVKKVFGLLGFAPEPPVSGGGTGGVVAAGR